jgi:hypothetical protein
MPPDTTSYVSDIFAPAQETTRGHWGRPSLSNLIAGFRREYLAEASECTVGWRLPSYLSWFEKGDFLENVDTLGRGGPQNAAQRLVSGAVKSLLPASFVEWRYYAILTPEFHGILGLSFFNPKAQLDSIAEGGLIAIFAGNVQGGKEAFCWQHLFPLTSLRFGGEKCETLEGHHQGVTLKVHQYAVNAARVELCGNLAPEVTFEHVGLPDAALFPFVVEDLKRVPGAHWIVHCPSPVAEAKGHFRMSTDVLASLGARSAVSYPNFASDGLKMAASAGQGIEASFHGSGYYEHSFGMNPLPLHGWDFMFAPDFEKGAGLVMQTYLRSDDMHFIEVLWTENGVRKYTRFGKGDFKLDWVRSAWHPDIRAKVPMERHIVGSRGGYTLEIFNHINDQLPFLRQRKLIVRHFFISEETGRTSWVLRNAAGKEVASSRPAGVLSGGEVAYPRIFTPGHS